MEKLLTRLNMGVVRLWSDMSTAAEVPYGTGCIVCTMEKANTYVNRLLEGGMLHNICCVVVDELHMVRRSICCCMIMPQQLLTIGRWTPATDRMCDR